MALHFVQPVYRCRWCKTLTHDHGSKRIEVEEDYPPDNYVKDFPQTIRHYCKDGVPEEQKGKQIGLCDLVGLQGEV